ncbi:MAG TPA: DUF29 domain-containing protein [Beijerinckiaceae bacterium]|jgi:hypothetical protein
MAEPVTKERPAASAPTRTRYEDDAYTWALEQVALLKSGHLDGLDVENLIDEVGDVARREYDKLVAALRIVLLHILKWDVQPERRTRSWILSIIEHRERVNESLGDNPGLKSRAIDALHRAYKGARVAAARETDLPLEAFPTECSYGWDDVMGRVFELTDTPQS